MYQEFNQHKKSDAVKWIIAFTLIIVLMAGVVAALILSLDKPTPIKPQENGTQQESSHPRTTQTYEREIACSRCGQYTAIRISNGYGNHYAVYRRG